MSIIKLYGKMMHNSTHTNKRNEKMKKEKKLKTQKRKTKMSFTPTTNDVNNDSVNYCDSHMGTNHQ